MVDVEKLLAAITEAEQAYVPDEPEDEFDFVIPKDEELHTLRCAHLMCGQNSKCGCTTPADVARRCAADRATVAAFRDARRVWESGDAVEDGFDWGMFCGLRIAVMHVAGAYGITEGKTHSE